jgi:hypothetical protein
VRDGAAQRSPDGIVDPTAVAVRAAALDVQAAAVEPNDRWSAIDPKTIRRPARLLRPCTQRR